MKKHPVRSFFLLLVMALLLNACGGGAEPIPAATQPPVAISGENAHLPRPSPANPEIKVEPTRAISAETVAEVALEQTATSSSLQFNNRLTAGEVDDNARWDDYLLYLQQYSGAAVIPVDISERHQIQVTGSAGRPVLGAILHIQANEREVMQLRTHSDGRAAFFPRALPPNDQAAAYNVSVEVNNALVTFTIPAGGSQREWSVVHPAADSQASAARLDVLFLVDATGSMADEINQLKDNIHAIAAQVAALPARPDLRLGLVAYRDRGDEYVARTFDFTPDVNVFAGNLAQVSAEGGGDYPEDLNQALSQAIHEPQWRVEQTVSLIFLVADAPPHLDYGQEDHYAVEMMNAASQGIKLFPIASSGLDEQGEYIFRQLAQVTGGRFIFLTYGEGGPGTTGTETNLNVSNYTVSALDDLVVRIIEEELSYMAH